MKRDTLAWAAIAFVIVWPLFNEDFSGLVYQDQPFHLILVDHLAAVGVLVGCKLIYAFYRRKPQGMIR